MWRNKYRVTSVRTPAEEYASRNAAFDRAKELSSADHRHDVLVTRWLDGYCDDTWRFRAGIMITAR